MTVTLSSLGFAQRAELGGPISGFVYEKNTRSLRPVLGVLGAAYLGEPVLSGAEAAAVSPNGRIALAVSEHYLIRLDLTTGEQTELSGAIAGDRVI